MGYGCHTFDKTLKVVEIETNKNLFDSNRIEINFGYRANNGGIDYIMNFTCQDLILPEIQDQPTDEAGQLELAQKWLGAMNHFAKIDQDDYIKQFASKGWAHKWFTKQSGPQFDILEEAIEVVERYYPRILERGIRHSEDMGLLLSSGWGKSEGVMTKVNPYDPSLALIQICCVTGPTNFDSIHGIEFEPGAKSHKIYLLYKTPWSDPARTQPDDFRLPDLNTLIGDLCIFPLLEKYPLINFKNSSRYEWRSEGWVSQRKLFAHIPWNKFTIRDKNSELRSVGIKLEKGDFNKLSTTVR